MTTLLEIASPCATATYQYSESSDICCDRETSQLKIIICKKTIIIIINFSYNSYLTGECGEQQYFGVIVITCKTSKHNDTMGKAIQFFCEC